MFRGTERRTAFVTSETCSIKLSLTGSHVSMRNNAVVVGAGK